MTKYSHGSGLEWASDRCDQSTHGEGRRRRRRRRRRKKKWRRSTSRMSVASGRQKIGRIREVGEGESKSGNEKKRVDY